MYHYGQAFSFPIDRQTTPVCMHGDVAPRGAGAGAWSLEHKQAPSSDFYGPAPC
jgi:hypothetical protein